MMGCDAMETMEIMFGGIRGVDRLDITFCWGVFLVFSFQEVFRAWVVRHAMYHGHGHGHGRWHHDFCLCFGMRGCCLGRCRRRRCRRCRRRRLCCLGRLGSCHECQCVFGGGCW